MRKLMHYARIRAKYRGVKLSQITVEECIKDMRIWEKEIFAYACYQDTLKDRMILISS